MVIVGSTLGGAVFIAILVIGIWWFYNRKRSKLAENKLYESKVNKAGDKSEVNKPQLFSHVPPLAYDLEQKPRVLELQGYREPVEM